MMKNGIGMKWQFMRVKIKWYGGYVCLKNNMGSNFGKMLWACECTLSEVIFGQKI